MKLLINTLGVFDLKIEDKSLLKEASRSYRIFRLFQYFLTFRDKKLLPDTIIDNLWQDSESFDPKNMLRAQIFRLRQGIKNLLPEDIDESKYLNISFNNGYYTLEVGELTIIDTDVFEQLIFKGDSISATNTYKAIEYYNEAIDLYKGYYLEENAYEIWLVPIRNYYNRLYLKTLFKLIELLKEKDEYEDIIILCEKAILIEPHEEALHIYLMEAMLKLGQIKNALSHYEYITTILSKEMRNLSSPGMKEIHRKILSYFNEKGEVTINELDKKLYEDNNEGPINCDSESFKTLFNMKKRKRKNEEEHDFIGLVTLNCPNCVNDDYKKWADIISNTLNISLRKGDAYTFWNESQVLILLADVRENAIGKIESRIKNNLPKNKYNMNFTFTKITEDIKQTVQSPT